MEKHKINILPVMNSDELQSLADDIRDNGLSNPIILYEGKILDGWNRYLACNMVNVKPKYKQFAKTKNPFIYVISENMYRRHMNPSQRAIFLATYIRKARILERKKRIKDDWKRVHLFVCKSKKNPELKRKPQIKKRTPSVGITKLQDKMHVDNQQFYQARHIIKEAKKNPEIKKHINNIRAGTDSMSPIWPRVRAAA